MNHIYSFHMGYNLYNTGTTGGFVATVVYITMRGFGPRDQISVLLGDGIYRFPDLVCPGCHAVPDRTRFDLGREVFSI